MGVWTLVDIKLSGNPLRCDCRLLATLRRLTDTAVGLRIDRATQCASPERLAGQKVSEALRHWRPTCADDSGVHTCDEVPCALPLSLASSSSLLCVTGSAVPPCVCAVALACTLARIVVCAEPRTRRTCSCRTTCTKTFRS